ncbi:uncharacterized protein C8Q71DRAFT_50623 [Rhodofomes roseus]|uniref:Xylosidase/arabinosidase n=1 Tax=Rhodofomes roseus TaxID=34475 RepID=A0ABQ8KFR4_9APHY|nr:uncharacterized protein C8Q71DRAFT_50623 [Rhodofomes roseus]KAH9836626.1 hypothetical protein C8Q71DRAFT_50623 [Rhodofomes roseus]
MALSSADAHGRMLKRADPSTIQNKFMVGYQGWFTCPGDGPPLDPHHHGWLHWFNFPIPDGGRPNTDLWPDLSEYSPSELYPAPGVKYPSGEQAFLFSSRNAKTVNRHFHWMAQHGVDGAFLQRFAGQTDLEAGNEAIRNQRDEVGDRVREAAEKEGRVFAIMYDVSGVPPERIQRVIEHDWMHLMHDKGILDSPNYLREKGKAVVTFWGFGFADSRHDPHVVRAITKFVRENTPGGAYIMAGTPAHWRTSVSDADPNPDFVNVWLEEFDAISPWTIGRYHNEESADWFEKEKIAGDVKLINERNERREQTQVGRKVDYIPVVFPGGSGHNLSEGKWGWNDAPRQGGRFLWRQLYNVRRHGVRIVYGAMWDEYDEGTAYLPVVSHKNQLPVLDTHRFMALDEDGYDLPPDWYMRICDFAAESLRGERIIHDTFPHKELQDYWSTHPRFEDKREDPVASGSGSHFQPGFDPDKPDNGDDLPPPPPYSLEDDFVAASTSSLSAQPSVTRHTSAGPPLPSKSTRPHDVPGDPSLTRAASVGSSSTSTTTSGVGGPPVNTSSRPPPVPPPVPSDANRPVSAASIDALADQFGRQSSIHGSHAPRPAPPPMHPTHAPAPHPYGPPPSSPSAYAQSWASPSPPPPAGWSQAPWPPPQWGAGPPQPHGPPSPWAYPGEAYRNQHAYGYGQPPGPGYGMPNAPPPPLRPRPSVSSHSSGKPSVSVEGSDFPVPYGPPSPYETEGGSSFGPAHASFPVPDASLPQGFAQPQAHAPYGGYSQGPGEWSSSGCRRRSLVYL